MTPAQWLIQADAALNALENASEAEQPEALKNAAERLGQLTQHLAQLPPPQREPLRPKVASLLGRIGSISTRLEKSRKALATEVKGVRQQGQAISAYMVSDLKNRT